MEASNTGSGAHDLPKSENEVGMVNLNTVELFHQSTTAKTRPLTRDELEGEIEAYILFPVYKSVKEHVPVWNFASTALPQGSYERVALNQSFESTEYLVLDYDGGYSIEEFLSRYAGFKFFLHTSFSHTKEQNRFRVIMPLDGSVTKAELLALKKSPLFPGIDPKSFEISRFFLYPCMRPDYFFKVNEGLLYPAQTIRAFRPEPQQKSITRDRSGKIKNPEKYLKSALPLVEKKISSFNIKLRGLGRDVNTKIFTFYKELYSLFEKCGSRNPDWEAKNVLLSHATHAKTISDINGKRL